MPKKGYTHIEFLLDRSGSMGNIKTDMEGGFNTFIADQKKELGTATVGLSQFDNVFEVVYEATPILGVPKLILEPRGMTALLDAICRSIDALGARLAKMKESQRPENVIFVIITDGLENSSREFSREDVKKRTEHQTDVYNWTFVYLGANQDAIAEGGSYGIAMANSMTYDPSDVGTHAIYDSLSSNVSTVRGGGSFGYTPEQRKTAANKK